MASFLESPCVIMRIFLLALMLVFADFCHAQISPLAPFFLGDRIVIPTSIDGKGARFVLDTGAAYTAVFEPAVSRLQLPVDAQAAKAGRELTKQVEISMFGDTARVQLDILEFDSNERVDGVFSWNDMSAPLLLIDGYDRLVATPAAPPAPGDTWQRWELENLNGQLFARITRDGRPYGRILIDTGAVCGMRVSPRLWRAWRKEHPEKGVTLSTFRYIAGETLIAEQCWAPQCSLGDLVFYDVPVSPLSESEVAEGPADLLGMVGIHATRRMRFLIDRAGGAVFTQSVPPAANHNRLGAVFVPTGSSCTVHVLEGGPAHRAGLATGDVLVEINGSSFRGAEELAGANAYTSKPAGTSLVLKVARGETLLEITVVLEELLP